MSSEVVVAKTEMGPKRSSAATGPTYWVPVEEFQEAVEEAIWNPAFTEEDFDE